LSLIEVNTLINKYKNSIILDTNLLVLYLIGLYDPNLIKSCSFLDKYCSEDFNALDELLYKKTKLLITPLNFPTCITRFNYPKFFSIMWNSIIDFLHKQVISIAILSSR